MSHSLHADYPASLLIAKNNNINYTLIIVDQAN